ncbi:tRNA 2-selenouridine(34) synthase MnmH [Cohnella lubricantis]|uniref:tRNA 2-selenouridine(34) synthase MnmH n=1 Tax=Cohnella lubricantis TaxID=2163172 RepID=A0A841TF09_9BACL|nr:tRNA 2-selenouridine(34) synthase MnmH [Cohnella lubricantis]MBB6677878.1 tRNA 2-selenouridine(34) synthase MnmH [Cohnella lubricantis]MBP2119060.1 tRNA 2-selenouridine synthase [Cohnella lubricantis]
MFQDLTIEDWIQKRNDRDLTIIDVRSPSEFADATIPGSVNIPLFNDEERAEVGTLYTQVNQQAAKERGLEIVSAKLPAFIRSFAEVQGPKAVFCWRGGMRSKTTATLLSLMDIHVSRLQGGYRAYRQFVVDTLRDYAFKPDALVLNGYTGSGKTLVLQELARRGAPVLDLEHLAGHRGSVFGHIGLKARNQKMFDSLLLDELERLKDERVVLFEAESARVGKAMLPDFLLQKKAEGRQIWLEMPIPARIRHILEDYRPWEHQDACLSAFRRVKQRIHTPVAAEIDQCLQEGKYDRAVELLLVYYYDPLYERTSEQYNPDNRIVVRAESVEQAADEIEKLWRK